MVCSKPVPPLMLSGIVEESIVDGPGLRYVVFTQGCPHACPGCHNPQTHAFSGGFAADLEQMVAQVEHNPLLRGVTLSGGEPFCQPEALCQFAKRIKALGKEVLSYSGYTIEQLVELGAHRPAVLELLQLCDILVDGPYLEAQRDLTLPFRGSANQRILQVQQVLPSLLRSAASAH